MAECLRTKRERSVFGPKLKLEKGLHERAKAAAAKAGYASVAEFLIAAIEKELARLEGGETDDARVEERLRGLGYIE